MAIEKNVNYKNKKQNRKTNQKTCSDTWNIIKWFKIHIIGVLIGKKYYLRGQWLRISPQLTKDKVLESRSYENEGGKCKDNYFIGHHSKFLMKKTLQILEK